MTYTFGPLTYADSRRVYLFGREVELEPGERRLLARLVAEPQRVFSTDELTALLDQDEIHPARTLDRVASRLRRKLNLAGADGYLIFNSWGVGYRLAESEFPASYLKGGIEHKGLPNSWTDPEGEANRKGCQSAQVCPRCNHGQDKEPLRFTFQGAAEFYCDNCGQFWQDFDYGQEDD